MSEWRAGFRGQGEIHLALFYLPRALGFSLNDIPITAIADNGEALVLRGGADGGLAVHGLGGVGVNGQGAGRGIGLFDLVHAARHAGGI